MRHFISLADITAAEMERILAIAEDLKEKYLKGIREPLLPRRVLALLFEKPSLRTRVSFESGMVHLGGSSLFLGEDTGFGKRESMADFARVLSELVDGVVIRSKKHATVVELAEYATCPVINGLTDYLHPCQTLADLFTIREVFGDLRGRKIAWIGDANNVARSLALGCGHAKVKLALAAPKKYQFDEDSLAFLKKSVPTLDFEMTEDPREAVKDASAVCTDVFASMGQEKERGIRLKELADFQVNSKLMAAAPKQVVFLHCLPARRGEEVTDEVMDGPQSVVVRQAGNRMHAQKGLLAWLLGAQA